MAEVTGVENGSDGLYDPTKGAQYKARENAEQMKTQFLTLLVAQLKNQDPMNPVENQDFVAQLAQFSSLEQLITINEGVEGFGKELKYLNAGMDYTNALLTTVFGYWPDTEKE